ncbi:lytic transglycosylase domain-containing protein [Methylobacterium nodulans]|uniref:Lytic transglycosylase catalytic n=1 Tax=Methylobacterium nodulans (strain LMG 21967 / CNCM I-2342 / ORS 2060) TaxID=460265 RepID=B8IWG5_METNO|nr:Lytic transglycosylase catalytic [Methylobacterium nodulans ORS 2060]
MTEKLARTLLTSVVGASLVAPAAQTAPGTAATETVEQALCRIVESSARAQGLPVSFLTRLIWRESSFRVGAVSAAGAQGVAQFMPGTARERGLADPFDPEQAIPHAAHLLADLRKRFGNLGLAAAAYNGGPARVASWIAGSGSLPAETRAYVYAVTGRPAEEWRPATAGQRQAAVTEGRSSAFTGKGGREDAASEPAEAHTAKPAAGPAGHMAAYQRAEAAPNCLQVTAALRLPSRLERPTPPVIDRVIVPPAPPPWGPWGVQLAGNFSKAQALESFARARSTYAQVIGQARPMIIGTRLLNRGSGAFYRVRIPAQNREQADALCTKIRVAGGACVVLKT